MVRVWGVRSHGRIHWLRGRKRAIEGTVRTNWLKLMYGANTLFGLFGLAVIAAPATMRGLLGVPTGDPIHFGIAAGAVPLAFGVAGLLGLRAPVKLSPVLGLQVAHTAAFLLGVVLPLAVTGGLPAYAVPIVAIFIVFVVGDLLAIPFEYLLS